MAVSANDAMNALKKHDSEKTVSTAMSFLITHLSKPEGQREFTAEKSLLLLQIMVDVLAWFKKKSLSPDKITSNQETEIARAICVITFLPKAFTHCPRELGENFLHNMFRDYTEMHGPSPIKFVLVSLYSRLRAESSKQKDLLSWLLRQLCADKSAESGLAFYIVSTCEEISKPDHALLDCLLALFFLAQDLFPKLKLTPEARITMAASAPVTTEELVFFPGLLLCDFDFFRFSTFVLGAVERPGNDHAAVMMYLNVVYDVWRKLRVTDAKQQRKSEREFAIALNPRLQTLCVEEVQFLCNWCHNSRKSARILLESKAHVVAIQVLCDENYDNAPMLEACLALLVNLARKQVASHHLLIDAGVVAPLRELLKDKKNNSTIVHQSLAFVLNLTSSGVGRHAFRDLPSELVEKLLPKYAKATDSRVLEMGLGALWGLTNKRLVARLGTDAQFQKRWFTLVFSAVMDNPKHFGIVHRGLGAILMVFCTPQDQPAPPLTTHFKASFPKCLSQLKTLRDAHEKVNTMIASDIDMLVQILTKM